MSWCKVLPNFLHDPGRDNYMLCTAFYLFIAIICTFFPFLGYVMLIRSFPSVYWFWLIGGFLNNCVYVYLWSSSLLGSSLPLLGSTFTY